MDQQTNEPTANAQIVRHMAALGLAEKGASSAKGIVDKANNRLKNMGFSLPEIKEAKAIIESGNAVDHINKQNRINQMIFAHGIGIEADQIDLFGEAVSNMSDPERARMQGEIAALSGLPSDNPYQSGDEMNSWLEGYEAGVSQRTDIDNMPEPEAPKRGRPASREDDIADDANTQNVDLSPPDDEEETQMVNDDDDDGNIADFAEEAERRAAAEE